MKKSLVRAFAFAALIATQTACDINVVTTVSGNSLASGNNLLSGNGLGGPGNAVSSGAPSSGLGSGFTIPTGIAATAPIGVTSLPPNNALPVTSSALDPVAAHQKQVSTALFDMKREPVYVTRSVASVPVVKKITKVATAPATTEKSPAALNEPPQTTAAR